MTRDEVLDVVREGLGCTEALFTLGDRPETRWPQAMEELRSMGYTSTIEYLRDCMAMVLTETSLIPHANPGVISDDEMLVLRDVSASQGLMLESISDRLWVEKGQPHYGSPDKRPARRLETIERAGRHRVPYTTGLLVGFGETRLERLLSLAAIRELHQRYGHIQEVIVQPFRAKEGTVMSSAPDCPLSELLWTTAIARIIMPPSISIQSPPNLSHPQDLPMVLRSGIDDWGGVSPLTADYVNPERPWPSIDRLREVTEQNGFALVARLPSYPMYVSDGVLLGEWHSGRVARSLLRAMDGTGHSRTEEPWFAGDSASSVPTDGPDAPYLPGGRHHPRYADALRPFEQPVRQLVSGRDDGVSGTELSLWREQMRNVLRREGVSDWVAELLTRALLSPEMARGESGLSEGEATSLLEARGKDLAAIAAAADLLRRVVAGHGVSYAVVRNINYTNVCYFRCQFCAFSKGKLSEALRGQPYNLPHEEIQRRVREAWERGATEVCLQGGIHPDYTGQTYLDILRAVKEAAPHTHVHAFSPLEVQQGASTLGISVRDFLTQLKEAGLGSLPGTAAEILDDGVRAVLCPDKLSTEQWVDVVRAAHEVGLKTTSTIMFGSMEGAQMQARHLLRIRDLQRETGGITEFVPLPFVHQEAPIYLKGRARRGPTFREVVALHAVARLALHPYVTNIQTSWVKNGPLGAWVVLQSGANDLGGTLMNESISRAAGATHGQEFGPREMEQLVASLPLDAPQQRRTPWQRTTLYTPASQERALRALDAAPLAPVENAPAKKYERTAA